MKEPTLKSQVAALTEFIKNIQRAQIDNQSSPVKPIRAEALARVAEVDATWKHLLVGCDGYKWSELAPGEWEFVSGLITAYWAEAACRCCGGRGHGAIYCATKKRIDQKCIKGGMRKLWGVMKYNTWYQAEEQTAGFN